ncbi:serine hydrolase domain-containing protein [Flavobacterium sp. ZT3R25]|uniref:serine hydrolase domain-containing protein n=1 Tax=Flavobacterium galactosi TaxID=3398735 RepID=UPI003A8ACAAF
MKNLFFLLFSIYTLSSFAQTISIKKSPLLIEAPAKSAGMSAERLAKIDAMCKEAIEKNEIPGAVVLVARNGKIIFYKAFGMADNESGKELKRDAIFRIASQTKAITSTAIMMLWEEGKFKLDDPISKYIPEFKNEQVLDTLYENGTYKTIPAKNPITIRHLLTHTSGIGYGAIDSDNRFKRIYKNAGITDLFTTENISIEESIKKLAKLPLHHNPGEKFTYSEGLDVLGYFIEIVSGMPLDQFYKTRIFDPLEMNDTRFYLPESKHNRLVSIQKKENGNWIKFPTTFYDPNYPVKGAQRFFSGGAGLSSTAKDYATFLQMYLNNGELNGIRLLSRTTVEFMMKNQIGNLRGDTGAYHGLAFEVIDEKGENMGSRNSKGTFGWGGYFNTQYFADPKENIIGIIMKQTQAANTDSTGWKFRQLVGQSIDD